MPAPLTSMQPMSAERRTVSRAAPTPGRAVDPNSAEAREVQRQSDRNKWITAFGGKVDNWEQSRTPYHQGIYESAFNSGRQAVDLQARDSFKQNAYEMARRGTQKSSIDSGKRGQISADYMGGLAGVHDSAVGLADAQRMADSETAQQYRLMSHQYQPGEQFVGGLDVQSLADDQRFMEMLAKAAELAYQGRVSNEELRGQQRGRMLGNFAPNMNVASSVMSFF